MSDEAETQLLPGAVGYRAPNLSQNEPPAPPGPAAPSLSGGTRMDLDNGDELGRDEDEDSTQPGRPGAGHVEMREAASAAAVPGTESGPNVCISFGTWGRRHPRRMIPSTRVFNDLATAN